MNDPNAKLSFKTQSATVPYGAVVKLISSNNDGEVSVFKVLNNEYLKEVLNKFHRYFSVYEESENYKTCEHDWLRSGEHGIYLGSINVYDDYESGIDHGGVYICRVILFGKNVYIVNSNSVTVANKE